MATTKKAATKTTKKTTKKAPSRPAVKTTVRRASQSNAQVKSFTRVKETEPFFTFRITHQTLYWLILSLIVLALGMWVVNINDKVQRIYDEIDQANAVEQSITLPKNKSN